jgi:formylglycine-generating enzyme required for sulfatase activity
MKKVLLLALLVLLLGCGPGGAPVAGPTARPAVSTVATDLPTGPPATAPEATAIPPTTAPAPTLRPTYSGPEPPAQAALGETWLRPTDGMIMAYVPAGTFQMGTNEIGPHVDHGESPQHAVTLDGFWIDQIEVTCAQYAAFLNVHGNRTANGGIAVRFGQGYVRIEQVGQEYQSRPYAVSYPVVMVTWYGAEEYCQWVGARLPTEAEWEYAARGPDPVLYPWGNDAPTCDQANFGDCARNLDETGVRPAGASWCGAQDMAGSVWEWVADWYGPYPSTPQVNPTGPASGDFRVMRGGGWHSPWWQIRTTARQHDTASSGYNG